VLWNGQALPTTFENSGSVRAQVAASLLVSGQTVGLAVRNNTPQSNVSPILAFEVIQGQNIYLPAVLR
jgi:hypothetical protein